MLVILLSGLSVLIANNKATNMTSKKYTPSEVVRLILQSLKHEATAEETAALQEWLQECESNRRFYERLGNHAYFESQLQEYMSYDSRQDWAQVRLRLKRPRKRIAYRLIPYAALLAIVATIAILIRHQTTPAPQAQPMEVADNRIAPGSSKAQLILENGESIDLTVVSDSTQQALANAHAVNTGKTLAYTPATPTATERRHTLRTPRGGEYELLLADGTKVWLNAETELTYPAAFIGSTRQVQLKGEAYFEVARDTARPFIVKANDMEVEVLGTSFNISAYPSSKRQTTLVEGKIAVALNKQHALLQPGEQATATPDGLEVREVNVLNYVSWRERRFIYEDQLLGEVMEDLGRWYNVEVFIANPEVYDYHLTANLPKYEDMNKVLEIIEYAAGVQFEVNNRTVVIRSDR